MPPPLLLLLSLIAMLILHLAAPIAPLPIALRWAGLAPLAIGIAINLLADRAFHEAGTPVKPTQPPTALLTTSVFRWTRNPMYLGFVLLLLGCWLLLGSVTPGAVVILFGWLMNALYVPREEAQMTRIFGDAYISYRRHVRRWA